MARTGHSCEPTVRLSIKPCPYRDPGARIAENSATPGILIEPRAITRCTNGHFVG